MRKSFSGRLAATAVGLGVLLSLALPTSAVAIPVGSVLIYDTTEPAAIVNDGVSALGLMPLRQWPANVDEDRWPVQKRVGKVSGDLLARQSQAGMRAMLEAEMNDPTTSGTVGVDEISRTRWSPTSARYLKGALRALGPRAENVLFYVGPSLVERVGRSDPRRSLDATMQGLLDAMALGGATYLEMYNGDHTPVSQLDYARYPTRWMERWPAKRIGALRLVFGRAQPEIGATQEAIWNWARASAAGRTLLANGAAIFAVRDPALAQDWVDGYRQFIANPSAVPPQGDYPVPGPGALAVVLPKKKTLVAGSKVTITMARRGKAVFRLAPRTGSSRGRVIGKFSGPTSSRGGKLKIPADTHSGSYRLIGVMMGDGITDRVTLHVKVTDPKVRAKTPHRGGLLTTARPDHSASRSTPAAGASRSRHERGAFARAPRQSAAA